MGELPVVPELPVELVELSVALDELPVDVEPTLVELVDAPVFPAVEVELVDPVLVLAPLLPELAPLPAPEELDEPVVVPPAEPRVAPLELDDATGDEPQAVVSAKLASRATRARDTGRGMEGRVVMDLPRVESKGRGSTIFENQGPTRRRRSQLNN